jgi:hypothetical protein
MVAVVTVVLDRDPHAGASAGCLQRGIAMAGHALRGMAGEG